MGFAYGRIAQNMASHNSRETPAATKSRKPALQARGENLGTPARDMVAVGR